MNDSLRGLTINSDCSIRDVIVQINANGKQFLLVVDEHNKLEGIVTDGDIRRAILSGVSLDGPVQLAMNVNPKTADAEVLDIKLKQYMRENRIRQLPVLARDGKLLRCLLLDDTSCDINTEVPIILMAGGRGQRLYPLTKDVPKPMLQVGNSPIIGHILSEIAKQGFRNVKISLNYLGEQIVEHVGDGSRFGLEIEYIWESQPLGTAGALSKIKGKLPTPFIVMNADILTDISLKDLVRFHDSNGCAATVAVREHLVQIPFGVITLEGQEIKEIVEKPVQKYLVSAGIYMLNPETITNLKTDEYCDMPQLLTQLFDSKEVVAAFPIHENWLDVGRPDDLALARKSDSEKKTNG